MSRIISCDGEIYSSQSNVGWFSLLTLINLLSKCGRQDSPDQGLFEVTTVHPLVKLLSGFVNLEEDAS